MSKGLTETPVGSDSLDIQFARLQGLLTPERAESAGKLTRGEIDDLQMGEVLQEMGLPVDQENFVGELMFALIPIQTVHGSYSNLDGAKIIQIHSGMFDAILAICRYIPTEVKRDLSFVDMDEHNPFFLNHLYFIASRWQAFTGPIWSDLEFVSQLSDRSKTRSDRIYHAVCSFIIGHEISHARNNESYRPNDQTYNHGIELAADRLGLEYAVKFCIAGINGGQKDDILPYVFLAPYIALALISFVGSPDESTNHPSLERRISNIDMSIESYYQVLYNPKPSEHRLAYIKSILRDVKTAGRTLITRFMHYKQIVSDMKQRADYGEPVTCVSKLYNLPCSAFVDEAIRGGATVSGTTLEDLNNYKKHVASIHEAMHMIGEEQN